MSELIKIGTRGSKLALWQAYHIESLLKESNLQTHLDLFQYTVLASQRLYLVFLSYPDITIY